MARTAGRKNSKAAEARVIRVLKALGAVEKKDNFTRALLAHIKADQALLIMSSRNLL